MLLLLFVVYFTAQLWSQHSSHGLQRCARTYSSVGSFLLFVTLLVGSNLLLEESLLLLEKRPPLSNKVLAYNT